MSEVSTGMSATVSALFSAFSAILAAIITVYLTSRDKIRSEKINILSQFLGNRHAAVPGQTDQEASHKFNECINKIPAYFKGKTVENAYEKYNETKTVQDLYDLYKTMHSEIY